MQRKDTEQADRYDYALLERLYDAQPLTVDMLPHSDEEAGIVDQYNAEKGTVHSKREIFIALANMRKKSQLKPKGKKRNASPVPRH